MCRLFGFRSVIDSQVHSSLVSAENALMNQSTFHPDGWGVAYYLANTPHIVKSSESAYKDQLFKKVSGLVSAKTVIAHLRKSTIGEITTVNTHPFQHGRWTFAHNGNVRDFEKHRQSLTQKVSESFRKYILGTTDSEVIFYFLLTHIEKHTPIHRQQISFDDLQSGIQSAVTALIQEIGPPHPKDEGPNTENFLTFIISDGTNMIGFHGGKNLHFSTYKTRCPERDTCPKFNKFCEAEPKNHPVNHLLFSSEPLQGENVWTSMSPGQLLGIDNELKLRHAQISW